MAVAARATWARGEWPGGLEKSLERAAGCEPNEDVRERMHKALRGEPLSPWPCARPFTGNSGLMRSTGCRRLDPRYERRSRGKDTGGLADRNRQHPGLPVVARTI